MTVKKTLSGKPAAQPTTIEEFLALGKKNMKESIEAKEKSNFDYEDGTFPMLWSAYDIKQDKNGAWGVLHSFIFLDEPYKDKMNSDWIPLMSRKEGEGHLFNSFLLQDLEKKTGAKADDLDMSELEGLYADALKEDQVWSCLFKTNPYTVRSGPDEGETRTAQRFKLLKRLEDYQLPKKGKKTVAAVKSGAKAKAKSECPFEEGEEVEIEQGTGTVVSIDEENSTIDVKVGKKTHKGIEWEDAEAVSDEEEEEEEEEEDEEAAYEEGEEVTFTLTEGKGKNKTISELTGTVVSVDDEKETLVVKVGKGKSAEEYGVDFADIVVEEEDEEEEEEESEDEEASFEEGDEVQWSTTTGKGKNKETVVNTGVILSVDMDEETCEVGTGETTGTGKKKTPVTEIVAFDDLEKVADEEEDEEEEEEESEDEEASFEEGDEVSFTIPADKKKKREEFSGTGKVSVVDEENETLTVTVGKGKNAEDYEVEFSWVDSDDEEDTEEEEDEEEGDVLEPGRAIEFKVEGTKKTQQGTVVSIDDEAGTCKVKVGKITKPINQDLIVAILERDEE